MSGISCSGMMGTDYRTIPTFRLVEMWEAGVNAVKGKDPSELTVGDYDSIYEMRKEIDRRSDEPKVVVDVNFSKDYLTD